MTGVDERGWVRLAPLEELPRGRAVLVEGGERPIALFHTASGVRAVDGTCPHAGGELSGGDFDDTSVTCPRHLWCYDLRTGKRRDRKGEPLHVYRTRIIDSWIWLRVVPD
ncbi:hypothetical protein BJF90_08270 [Pseudonocardia sp. CNS-004]|nr:hypothetical protein BJF90_08270 [Pseudonocardia sp. CNS-004]